jgi:lathosterol oxidase
MSFLVSVAVLSAVYAVVGCLERTAALRARRLPSPRPYLLTDSAWYGLALVATAVSVFVFRPVLAHLSIGPVRSAVRSLPFLVQLLLAVVVFDFVSFLVHRSLHRREWLWRIHKVHHSTLELDGFATTRTHMMENLLRFVPPQALLLVAGEPAGVVAAAVAIAAVYGVSNHSNIGVDLCRLEPVLVTPRLHHRHHVPATTQSNFGGIFTIWDRLFGSLVCADTGADERFGVPGEIDTYPQRFSAAFRRPFDEMQRSRPRPT